MKPDLEKSRTKLLIAGVFLFMLGVVGVWNFGYLMSKYSPFDVDSFPLLFSAFMLGIGMVFFYHDGN